VVERMRWYRAQGFHIALQTSRQMRTFQGNVGLINARMLPELVAWLDRHDIPYDEIHVGKPWAGREGFYVDDRAVRPAEFLRLSPEEIAALLARDSVCDA
jgi:capsule biosynthesis phosphatase